MGRCEEFLNLYRELEELLSAREGGSRPGLVQDFGAGEGYKYREELLLFRELRNLLSHHAEIEGEDAVVPSASAVKKLREILSFAKNPPAAMHIAVPAHSLYTASPEDTAAEVTEKMELLGFSHVPVTDRNGVLTGVFSAGALLSYIRSNPDKVVSTLTMRDMQCQLDPENHVSEQYAFVGRSASCYRIKNLFRCEGPDVRRVAALFVTADGRRGTRLAGMITPWDVIRYEKG